MRAAPSSQKETDILDVWIDSGVSADVVCVTHSELRPGDYGKFIYLEGSDQHRGWFHSSLLFNLAATGEEPYDTVVTHGFVLDGKGQKMSKSMGNTVTPEEILKTLGADILRWWTASVDYNDDVRISKQILERSADAYRKIRNTLRFLLGALADFDPARDQVPRSRVVAPGPLGVGFLPGRLSGQVTEAFRTYQYLDVTQSILGFCQLDLSGRYFEIIKDRLYCDALDSPRRRSCRTVCWKLAQGLAVLLAPVLSFTADEVWENIPGAEGHVFEQRFPEGGLEAAPADWERFWAIREAVQGAMEPHRAAKTIGTSLDAAVRLILDPADSAILEGLGESAEDLLVVSGLTLEPGPDLQVEVSPHEGVKCPRCWNHKGGHGQGEEAELCPRCWDVFRNQA